jgi:hypothetical protein
MKEIYFHNGKAYIILRRVSAHNVSDRQGNIISELFNAWKEHLGADHVLKNSTHFMYCETIPDIEWEEVTEDC